MDAVTLEMITVSIFVITYVLIAKFYKWKAYIIWSAVLLFLLIGSVSFTSAFQSIKWNVIGIYIGMLFIAEALVVSRIPDYLAIWVTNKSKKVHVAMLFVCLLTGILSIVIENVACVLIVAPIVFSISKRLKISPVPMIIGIAISSNLQGVATLIGDPPSMLLAGHTGMNFNDFIFFQGKPGLFFAVQIGMIASLFVLYYFFRKNKHKIHHMKEVTVESFFPGLILVGMILVLAFSSLIFGHDGHIGLVCLMFGLVALIWMIYYNWHHRWLVWKSVKLMDWATALFIIAVFILVQSLTEVGAITGIAEFIYGLTGNDILFSFVIIVLMSVVFSAFVDNVPYIVAMLPVVEIVAAETMVSPYVLYFGLLIGASVGGNITPVGASANIVGAGLLKNHGYEITFWQFVKIGLPFTLVSVAVSAGFIWIMFG